MADNGIYRCYSNTELLQVLKARKGKSSVIDTLIYRLENVMDAYENSQKLLAIGKNRADPVTVCPICEASLVNKIGEDND